MDKRASKSGLAPMTKVADAFRKFLHLESSSGILLLIALAIALAWANSPLSDLYFHLLEIPIGFDFGSVSYSHSLHHWINDGLMTLFFFVVGSEIKREMVSGELATIKQAAFPMIAALGGMVVPALIYMAFNQGHEGAKGWGIPMATDIPFALGILALLGNRIPVPLKIFLMALAIIDDLGAILVIAVFYTNDLSWGGLGAAAAVFGVLVAIGRAGVGHGFWYAVLGIMLWYLLLSSGVHGTIAGVLVAWTIPCHAPRNGIVSPLQRMEERLHPWTSYLILPLFALANAGVRIDMGLLNSLWNRTSIGIFLGLVVGKPVGIFAACWAALAMGFPALSGGVRLKHLLGAGMLGGIGFTMSIFISGLAFGHGSLLDTAKVSVFIASVLSGALGWAFLRLVTGDSGKSRSGRK
jgi:Na+:H+ antiporter, NhaA family